MSETMMSQANENTENVDQKALELAQDFSYDGYQVVRRELFAHLREPAGGFLMGGGREVTFTGTGGCNSERQCNI